MASIVKVKARWAGFQGAPGWSNFYFRDFSSGEPVTADAQGAVDRINTFFGAVKTLIPPVVNVTVQPDVEVIDDATGNLTNVLTVPSPTAIAGTAAVAAFSMASGVVITWRTGGVVAGRRVRGRTFLVPTANIAYDTDGTLQASTVTTLQTAANALIATTGTPDLGVWSRPHDAHVNAKGEQVPARAGSWYVATSATIPDKVAILRSRRD